MFSLLPTLALALGVPAPIVAPAPVGPAPTLIFVRTGNNGGIEYQSTETQHVPVEVETTVNVNGKQEIRKSIVYKPVTVIQMKSLEKSSFDVLDVDGKKVEEAVWNKTLKGGVIVLFSGSAALPDSAYLKALKADTLVVVVTKSAPINTTPAPVINPIRPIIKPELK
jgi:hypothetical protein